MQKNDSAAVYWFQQSMIHNNLIGKGNYGIMLYEGRGGLKMDKEQGLYLIRQAADVGIPFFREYLMRIDGKSYHF